MAFVLAIKMVVAAAPTGCVLTDVCRGSSRRGKPRHYKSANEKRSGLASDGFGDARLAWGDAVLEETAGGQEFGVE